MKSPCRDCENRTERCHGTCPDYNEWKAEREAEKRKAELADIYRRGIYTERKRRKK